MARHTRLLGWWKALIPALEKGIKFAAFFFLRPQLSFRDIFWESRASQLGTTPPFSFLATLQAA
jgi:hypothetical protein